MSLPPTDPKLRHAAVTAAVAARQRRAAVRRLIKHGEWNIDQFMDAVADDPVLQRMRVKDVVTAFPGLGPARANAMLVTLKIAPERRVGTLGPRQHERFVAALQAHA